jgi:hypothetical protein
MEITIKIFNYLIPTFGLIGTCLIFYFGVPRQIDTGGKIGMCLEREDEQEAKKIKKYKFWGNIGLILIALSFFSNTEYISIRFFHI